MGVDAQRSTAVRSDWRTFLATEPNERFVGFGRPVLSPAAGEVVVVHEGEPDHPARRSWTVVPYLWSQARRVRAVPAAVAGNHVGLALDDGRTFVFLVHLRLASLQVAVGDVVREGQVLAACGSSGSSTQPHVHVQATDHRDVKRARGVPVESGGSARNRHAVRRSSGCEGFP